MCSSCAAIEFAPLTIEFVVLAVEFLTLAIEFITLAGNKLERQGCFILSFTSFSYLLVSRV